jgi:hypothetical protein
MKSCKLFEKNWKFKVQTLCIVKFTFITFKHRELQNPVNPSLSAGVLLSITPPTLQPGVVVI